jgi:uncharacterized protein YcaQ
MEKTLLATLREKYGDEYNIMPVEQFHQYKIEMYETEDGNSIYKLKIKFCNEVVLHETWHTNADTILYRLLNL